MAPSSSGSGGVRERACLPGSAGIAEALRFLPQALVRPGWLLTFLRGHAKLELPMAFYADGSPVPFEVARTSTYERWLEWKDLDWIPEVWDCPIVVKGVLSSRRTAAGRR